MYLKLCELVVSPDVGVVGGERHEEVDQGEHHQEAGDRRDDKHHLKILKFYISSFYELKLRSQLGKKVLLCDRMY
jgi:hypothetical protein